MYMDILIPFNELHKFAYVYITSCVCYSVPGSCLSLQEPPGQTGRSKFMIKSEIRKISLQLFLALILSFWQWSKSKRKQTFWAVLSEALKSNRISWNLNSLLRSIRDRGWRQSRRWKPMLFSVLKKDKNLGKSSFFLFFLFSCPNWCWIISDVFKKPNKRK